jgi:hypothetical protein
LTAALFVLAQTALPAQQAALPPGRTIVARHLDAIGGAAAFKSVKSIHAKGTFELTAQQITGTLDVMSARPGKMRVRLDITGIGKAENCYDGKIAWEIDPTTGPAILTGRRLTEIADDAWFDNPLYEPSRVKEITTVSKDEFDRRPAYKLKVVLVSGTEQFEYFDVDTGLQLGSEASRAMAMGILPMTSVLRDYKKFGPIMHATTLMQRTMGLEQVFRLTSVELDTVPADAFDPPPQIKALIK